MAAEKMLYPIIKSYHCADVDLWGWSPDTSDDVYLTLELSIGMPSDKKADGFQLIVATPEAIRSRLARTGSHLFARHILLIDCFDWPSVQSYCISILSKCGGFSWEEIAQRLSRYFLWEFEDYISSQD